MANYMKFNRDKFDTCNICLQKKELSWDHIPPKGGYELTEVEQWNIMQYMIEGTRPKHTPSQNGVKYRTICQECNNTLLGANYDSALNTFAEEVGRYIKSSLYIPEVVRIKTKPIKIIKSVLGHLLAAKSDLSFSLQDDAFREFLLDSEMKVPNGYKVYYWVYPYNNVRVMQNFALAKVYGPEAGTHGIFSTLKYFPIAYLVTDKQTYEGLDELTQYCTNTDDIEVEIPIRMRGFKRENWPEVDENIILLAGDDMGVFARPRGKKRKNENQIRKNR